MLRSSGTYTRPFLSNQAVLIILPSIMKPSSSQIAFPGPEADIFACEAKAHIDFLEIKNKTKDSDSTVCAVPHHSVRISNNVDLLQYLNHTKAETRVA